MSTPETTAAIDTERAREIVAVLLTSRIGHVAAEVAMLVLTRDEMISDLIAQRVYAMRDAASAALGQLPVEALIDEATAYTTAREAIEHLVAGDRDRSCD